MYLGLDLGTSGLKAIILDDQGHVIAQANTALTVQTPHPLWSEQDAEDWWLACKQSILSLAEQGHDLSRIKSLGVAGQMHGATLLDSQNNVLRPVILWNDGRSAAQCVTLKQREPNLEVLSGNLAMPGFTAPKLLWVAENEPDVFAKTAKVLLPKDYLNFRLTGTFSSEMSDAAGTLWLNPETRDWSDELLTATGLTRDHMPTLYEGHQVIGYLTASVAAELGLPVVPVVAGAGDNAAGAIGVGVTDPGQAFISLGTSGVYFVVSDKHHASPENTVHAFCHCLPNRWHQMSVMLSAAQSLSWFADLVKTEVGDLLVELDDSGIEETAILFLPYLSGERTPHNNPNAVGSFFGLTQGTSRAEMTLAVLQGVSFSFADGQDALDAAGTPINDITLIGGGARSARWRQMLADVLNRPLTFREGGEVGPALGAARLALLQSKQSEQGITDNSDAFNALVAEICPAPSIVAVHRPDLVKHQKYQQKLNEYRALYQQTRTIQRIQ